MRLRRKRGEFNRSDADDYWPLTIVPSMSRPRRPVPWTPLAAVIVLLGALALAHAQGIGAK